MIRTVLKAAALRIVRHFWAVDDAAKLANGLRDALDKTNVARS